MTTTPIRCGYDGTPLDCQNRSDPDDPESHICGDEGRSRCPSCEAIAGAYWRAEFGLTDGMTRDQRRAQLERVRPIPVDCRLLRAASR